MNKIQFKNLLQRYTNGTCTDQERVMVERWYELLDEDHRQLFPSLDLAQWEDELWELIKEKTIAYEAPVAIWYQNRFWWRIAASILLMVSMLGWWLWNSRSFIRPTNPIVSESGLERKTNLTTQPMVVVLSDGSSITLNPAATIEFPKQWNNTKREVYLLGDAFFKVTQNPEKPFLVYANGIVTKVLGTSFWVRSNTTTNQVEIAVVTGKVSVSKQNNQADTKTEAIPNGVILTPNQQVKYFPENEVFVTSIVKEPVLIKPEVISKNIFSVSPSFRYDEQAVAAVLQDIEKAYGIEIIVENEQLKTCPLTADLSESPLFTKLDIICATLKASYEVRGTKILISGKGCQ